MTMSGADKHAKQLKQKAKQAVQTLQAVGIESACLCTGLGGANSGVRVSPEDAMKMLLLTEGDTAGLLKTGEKIRLSMRQEVADIQAKMRTLFKLSSHSPERCNKGEHVTTSFPTGGSGGHVLISCLACDYSLEDWAG